MKLAPTLTLLVGLLAVCGCGAGIYGYQDALSDWRGRHYDRALARSSEHYERVRDDNRLAESQVAAAVDTARKRLAEVPIVTSTDPPPAPPAPSLDRPPTDLGRAIRGDLLSNRVTRIFRAAGSVAALGLREHAPTLIAVVFSRLPVVADGGVLDDAGVALRSVAAKRAALDALSQLAGGGR